MLAVTIKTEPTFRPDVPRLLFEKVTSTGPMAALAAQYDVSHDDQRFLMLEPVEPIEITEIMLVQNWFQELERLVPTNN